MIQGLRRMMVPAAVMVGLAGGALSPAAAQTTGAAVSPAAAPAASVRMVNVVGLPVKLAMPASWSVASPMALARSGSTDYPVVVRTQARAEHVSPATWVKQNRMINVMGVLYPRSSFSQGIVVTDLGQTSMTFARFKTGLAVGVKVTGTSQVRTRFGMAYRVHFVDTDAHSGLRYRGVAALVHVHGHSVVVSTSGLTSAAARYPNDLALSTAMPR